MGRAVIVKDAVVVNVILTEGEFTPPEGHYLYPLPDDSPITIGWVRVGSDFTPPTDGVTPPPVDPPDPLQARIDDLQSQLDELTLMFLGGIE